MAESTSQNQSVYRLRWIGYGLLIFALIDALFILIPPGFTNPEWEFQAIGNLVERVVVPLLGLGFVFFGEYYDRRPGEKIPIKILSWLCLLLAVLYILMLPLGLLSTLRIKGQLDEQARVQVERGLAQLNQVETQLKTQLNQLKPEDLRRLVEQARSQGVTVTTDNPEALKAELLTRLNAARQQLPQRAEQEIGQRKQGLYKNAVKWLLGAFLGAVLFFILWRSTAWARE